MDCSLPDSSIHGIFQATVLEWFAISFSKDLNKDKDSLDRINCAQKKKKSIEFIKILNVCFSKDAAKKIKRQATKWEKIYAKYTPKKETVFRINDRLSQSSKKAIHLKT